MKDFHTIGTLRFCSVEFRSMMGHWTLQDLSIPINTKIPKFKGEVVVLATAIG
jgi:hypothetical protein